MAEWYRARSISGKPSGLGFSCPICGLHYPVHAPDEIKHCGTVDKAPRFTLLLPERQMGKRPLLPRNMLLVGDWEVT